MITSSRFARSNRWLSSVIYQTIYGLGSFFLLQMLQSIYPRHTFVGKLGKVLKYGSDGN